LKGFKFSIESKIARISEQYAKIKNITVEESMRKFLSSGTYRLLNDSETGLYLEVTDYVYDIFLEELAWEPQRVHE